MKSQTLGDKIGKAFASFLVVMGCALILHMYLLLLSIGVLYSAYQMNSSLLYFCCFLLLLFLQTASWIYIYCMPIMLNIFGNKSEYILVVYFFTFPFPLFIAIWLESFEFDTSFFLAGTQEFIGSQIIAFFYIGYKLIRYLKNEQEKITELERKKVEEADTYIYYLYNEIIPERGYWGAVSELRNSYLSNELMEIIYRHIKKKYWELSEEEKKIDNEICHEYKGFKPYNPYKTRNTMSWSSFFPPFY